MKKIHFKVVKLRKQVVNIVIAVMLVLVSGVAVLAGVNSVQATSVSGVYYNGDKANKNISLMVNVYWGTEYIDSMLEIFEKNDVKTTFFVGGTWAISNEEKLNKILEKGHELGNHGYHHKDHDKISEEENLNQIKNTHKIVKELTGVDMNLFAPPSGAHNKITVSAATSLGYKTIMWTRDTIDWRDKDENLIYNRAVKNPSCGDLILMHPTECTVKALPRIIQTLKSQGFNLTNVSENIGSVES